MDEFEWFMQEFYTKLESQQEELGPEIQKILDEHFWELLDENPQDEG